MSIDPFKPHDALVKQLLGNPSDAAIVLRTLLPAGISDVVDWSSLRASGAELPGENGPGTQTDLLFEATLDGEPAIVLIVIEHQSSTDPLMPLRMLRTMTALWRRWEVEHGGRSLPVIVPLVLAHAAGGWTTARSMDALFSKSPASIPGLEHHLPRFELLIIDLTATDRDQLSRWVNTLVAERAAAQAVMLRMLVVARDASNAAGDTASAVLADMANVFETLVADPAGRVQFQALMFYVMLTVPNMTWDRARGILSGSAPRAASIMSSLREMALAQEFERGRSKEAEAMLNRLLTAKFGELSHAHKEKLEAATLEQLETYIDRLMFADTIDAVLSE